MRLSILGNVMDRFLEIDNALGDIVLDSRLLHAKRSSIFCQPFTTDAMSDRRSMYRLLNGG